MTVKTIAELLEQISTRRVRPTIADFLFLRLLTDADSADTQTMLRENSSLSEIRDLLSEAVSGDEPTCSEASSALLAWRESIIAEEAGDRDSSIKHSKAIISYTDCSRFPLTCGQAYLKIGTALAVKSQTRKKTDENILTEAIQNLEQSLSTFGESAMPDLRCLAHYDLARAFHGRWMRASDWDEDAGGSSKENAIRHGTAALHLMDAGCQIGDRLALTRIMIELLISDRTSYQNKETHSQIAKMVEGLLASNDAARLDPDTAEAFQNILKENT
ncbi:hypothetical protein [Tunturiibacter gelidoferens]|uniref:DNA-binding transcriptional MerR regulator n=1 Tax=Tunturiibacter lichenicola TaxID=2051959 RepID=A0A7Y9TAE4_9BACT|nr:hypothetical protein [Edaphobacter lichenicola]NYF52230.1 DNA-binding transcriptional MerR regulator [Edaphobacter lichenicola]